MAAPGGHAPSPSRVHDLQRKEETEDPDHVLQGEEGPLPAPGPDPTVPDDEGTLSRIGETTTMGTGYTWPI